MRGWTIAMVVLVGLAGCAQESNDEGLGGTAMDEDGGDATNGTVDAGNVTGPSNATLNAPPVADLSADLVNGSAPLMVNFTLNGTDADGDNLTWTLYVGALANGTGGSNGAGGANGTSLPAVTNLTQVANGTTLPAVVNHTFEAGNFSVILEVSDGTNTTYANTTVTAVAGEAGPVVVAVYEGSGLNTAYALTNDPLYAIQCPGFLAGRDATGCVFLELTEGPHDDALARMDTDATNVRLAMWDTCSPTGSGKGFYGGVAGDEFTVAAGTGCIVAWSNHADDRGQQRTWTMTVFG